jgi:hypothetical protein
MKVGRYICDRVGKAGQRMAEKKFDRNFEHEGKK